MTTAAVLVEIHLSKHRKNTKATYTCLTPYCTRKPPLPTANTPQLINKWGPLKTTITSGNARTLEAYRFRGQYRRANSPPHQPFLRGFLGKSFISQWMVHVVLESNAMPNARTRNFRVSKLFISSVGLFSGATRSVISVGRRDIPPNTHYSIPTRRPCQRSSSPALQS